LREFLEHNHGLVIEEEDWWTDIDVENFYLCVAPSMEMAPFMVTCLIIMRINAAAGQNGQTDTASSVLLVNQQIGSASISYRQKWRKNSRKRLV